MKAGHSATARSVLFRQLAVAARRNVPLDRVMAILVEDPQIAGKDAESLKGMASGFARGERLSAVMSDRSSLFAMETAQMVKQAEQSGRLPDVLDGLAADFHYDGDARRALRHAMSWPLVVIGVAVLVFSILAIFVVPQFQSFYSSLGAELPAATRRFIAFTSWFRSYWWALILLAVLVVQLYRNERYGRGFAAFVRQVVYKLPFAGGYAKTLFSYRLAGWLYRFRDDPPLQKLAVGHLRATTAIPQLQRVAAVVEERLAIGRILSEALAADTTLPARFSQFARLGEALQSFDEPLAQLQELFESDADYALGRLERGLMLTFYVVMAVAVGSLVMALYEPIFHLGSVV